MITTARQLKDLIRNMSKKKSADAQILMRNYMMERFLERISLSEYKNQFILKGGMLVAAMVGLDARATMDLDATIKGTNVSVEDVEMIISQRKELHHESLINWNHIVLSLHGFTELLISGGEIRHSRQLEVYFGAVKVNVKK